MKLFKGLYNKITKFLTKPRPETVDLPRGDFERMSYEIRPCDVILVCGDTHVSEIIKTITQSHWSHTALYIGRLHEIESGKHRQLVLEHGKFEPSEQLVIESEMGRGTVITSLSHYKRHHTRICRPHGLLREDAQKIINYAVEHLGREYDVRQILDLARFLFPWSLYPRRWRSTLFSHNAGTPTKEVCSTLIAESFASVDFPVLPITQKTEDEELRFIQRNPRLFTPSDFDFSPFFEIIKYPLTQQVGSSHYRRMPWNREVVYSDLGDGKLETMPAKPESEVVPESEAKAKVMLEPETKVSKKKKSNKKNKRIESVIENNPAEVAQEKLELESDKKTGQNREISSKPELKSNTTPETKQ